MNLRPLGYELYLRAIPARASRSDFTIPAGQRHILIPRTSTNVPAGACRLCLQLAHTAVLGTSHAMSVDHATHRSTRHHLQPSTATPTATNAPPGPSLTRREEQKMGMRRACPPRASSSSTTTCRTSHVELELRARTRVPRLCVEALVVLTHGGRNEDVPPN